MKIVFLGTNGWYPTPLGDTSCVLIDSEEYYVVFDAGSGIQKLDQYVTAAKPVKLFLSHLHLDHIVGFHVFGKFNFKGDITIYGDRGTIDGLKIIRHPYTAPFSDLRVPVEIKELNEGAHNLPFPVTCRPLVHADPCLGYRVELDGRTVVYCTDTGVCDSLYQLAEHADLLVMECSSKSGQTSSRWPHLRPEDSANIAKSCNAKRLVLTHFDAHRYRTIEERSNAEATARTIFPETVAAHDGLEIELQ